MTKVCNWLQKTWQSSMKWCKAKIPFKKQLKED